MNTRVSPQQPPQAQRSALSHLIKSLTVFLEQVATIFHVGCLSVNLPNKLHVSFFVYIVVHIVWVHIYPSATHYGLLSSSGLWSIYGP